MTDELPQFTIPELETFDTSLPSFSNDDAVTLGLIAVQVIRESGLNLAVDIVRGNDLVFRAKLGASGPGNDPWLAGKAAAARLFGVPSLLVRLRNDRDAAAEPELTYDPDVVRAHGGSIPLFVAGVLAGTITMSGEPDVVDHAKAAEALRRYRGF